MRHARRCAACKATDRDWTGPVRVHHDPPACVAYHRCGNVAVYPFPATKVRAA